jgi:multidrug efflux pump subunit AcrA (membrane-fusion protein)
MNNSGGLFKPGMFVTVLLGGVSSLNGITLPTEAIVTDHDKRIVFVQDPEGHFQKREVTVGDETEGRVLIKTGIADGERVVTKGAILLNSMESS